MLLDVAPGTRFQLRTRSSSSSPVVLDSASPLCFIPADVPLWSSITTPGSLRHLDVHLDLPVLDALFPDGMDTDALRTPRLAFADDRLISLARLIAGECSSPASVHDVYGESLAMALVSLAVGARRPEEHRNGRLTERQLRKVTDFMRCNCSRNVSLQELADTVGLSASYFAQAFKVATGVPPYRWHLRLRVERAKELLSCGEVTPTEAAAAMGFADQAHLTRVFRRFEGTTPAAWLRAQRG